MKQNISQKQQFFLHGVGNRFFIPKFNVKSKIRLLYLYVLKKAKKMSYKLEEILNNATSQGYKSNAIKPLNVFLITTLIFTAIFIFLKVLILAYIIFGVFCLTGIVYVCLNVYYLNKDPDILRSEKYNLEKNFIEKATMLGDSSSKIKTINPEMDYTVFESLDDISDKNKNE